MCTIRLVPFGEEHDAAFTAMLADAEIARFTPLPQPVPPGFAATWRRRYDEHRPHRENFAVVDADGTFLGIAVAPMLDHEARTAELGYAVVPSSRGQGVGLEVLRQLTAWAVDLGMQRLFLLISVENTASKRVARRAGYRFEGVLRARYVKPGVRQDTESWSFLPGDG